VLLVGEITDELLGALEKAVAAAAETPPGVVVAQSGGGQLNILLRQFLQELWG
jgi:hypothetical protein